MKYFATLLNQIYGDENEIIQIFGVIICLSLNDKEEKMITSFSDSCFRHIKWNYIWKNCSSVNYSCNTTLIDWISTISYYLIMARYGQKKIIFLWKIFNDNCFLEMLDCKATLFLLKRKKSLILWVAMKNDVQWIYDM